MSLSSNTPSITALALLLIAGSTQVAHADPPFKVAVVDMQRAMNETEDGRKAKANLKKVFEERQKVLDKQQNDLKALKESLEKQRDVLSRDVLAKKLEEYQKAFADLQTTYMEFQRELQSKEGELTKDIIERMQRIMRRVGQTEGYTLVLERSESGVVYVPSNYDLTDLLIQRYNAGEGKGETASAPATTPVKPPRNDDGITPRGVNLDITRILRILPHRPPLLLIDRVIDIEPRKSARAIKCVSVNEPVLAGHFPGEPVFPSVLCVEAMSQLVCVLLYASRAMDPAHQRFAFAGIEKAKFRQPVVPGDTLELAVSVVHHRSNIWKCSGTASVDDVLCVEAELLAAIQDIDDA